MHNRVCVAQAGKEEGVGRDLWVFTPHFEDSGSGWKRGGSEEAREREKIDNQQVTEFR